MEQRKLSLLNSAQIIDCEQDKCCHCFKSPLGFFFTEQKVSATNYCHTHFTDGKTEAWRDEVASHS